MANETGTVVDPYRAYNFKLEFDKGVTEGHFTSCSGLGVSIEVIPYREAGSDEVRQLPGRTSYCRVKLQYGLTDSKELWNWLMDIVKGKHERRNVSIVQIANDGVREATRWNLLRAWPAALNMTHWDALSQEAAIESLTLVYEKLERD